MRAIASVDDLRDRARACVPKVLFDHAEGGSYQEISLKRNERDLDERLLRQRALVDVSERDTGTTIFGREYTMPLGLAPVGLMGLFHPDGEIHACRAARKFGVPYCLSTVSVCSIEQVAASAGRPFWFQLYMMKDRGFVRELVERAREAGCDALVVTVDLQVPGRRRRDIRNGLSTPLRLCGSHLLDALSSVRWMCRMRRRTASSLGNIDGHVASVKGLAASLEWAASQYDASVTPEDIEWIREIWDGILVVKGILEPNDASAVVASGVDGLVVSNHGGRQMDATSSPVSMLPEIVERVAGEATVLVDGGVRSGLDVLKYIEAGAQSVLAGRSFLYGLSAHGESGVRNVLDIMYEELDTGMALTGRTSLSGH